MLLQPPQALPQQQQQQPLQPQPPRLLLPPVQASLSPLAASSRPLSPRDLQSQPSDPPFTDVHVVAWEEGSHPSSSSQKTAEAAADAAAPLFIIAISTSKPLPARFNSPYPNTLCIRRSFDDFLAFNTKLQGYLLKARDHDAIILDKKRKQSQAFLTLPKRGKLATTIADNEERVILLDAYLQDILSLSPIIWSLDFVEEFFSPTSPDWEITRKVEPEPVRSRSNWRPGALFRPRTVGRRNGNPDKREVGGRTPPAATISSSNLSRANLHSVESLPVALRGNVVHPLNSTHKLQRAESTGEDDAPLEEDWLAPIEQLRRSSRQMMESDKGTPIDAARPASLLPKFQNSNVETVSSSALNQVISALYDEAAKGPPRNSVVARKFVVASAVADADIRGVDVEGAFYSQVLASLDSPKKPVREELFLSTISSLPANKVTKKRSRPLPETPLNIGARSASLTEIASDSNSSITQPTPLSRSDVFSKSSLLKKEVLETRKRSGSAPIKPQPPIGSARPPISARSSSRLEIVSTQPLKKSDIKEMKAALASRRSTAKDVPSHPKSVFSQQASVPSQPASIPSQPTSETRVLQVSHSEVVSRSRSPSPPPPLAMSAGPQSGGLLGAPNRRLEPKVLVADGAIVPDVQSEYANPGVPPVQASSESPQTSSAQTPATVAAQLTSYLAKLAGYGTDNGGEEDTTEDKRRTVASYAYDDEDENAFETMTNITGPLADDGNFWAPTTRKQPAPAPAPRRPVSSIRESIVSRREDAPIVIKRGAGQVSRPASPKDDQSVAETNLAMSEIAPSDAVDERRPKRVPGPNIPTRNSSALDLDSTAPSKGAPGRSAGHNEEAHGDSEQPRDRRKSFRNKVTTAWVNDVSLVKEQRAPPASFIGQAFGDFGKGRRSSFLDEGSSHLEEIEPEEHERVSHSEYSNDYNRNHSRRSNGRQSVGDAVDDSFIDHEDTQWRSGSTVGRMSSSREMEYELHHLRKERTIQSAGEKLLKPSDFYKVGRGDSRNGSLASYNPRESFGEDSRVRDAVSASATSSPTPDQNLPANKGKSSLRSIVIGTINRTLRRKKSNMNENMTLSANVISDPLGLENSRRHEKMEPIPLRPEEDFRAVTLERGRGRTASRPSMEGRSRSPSKSAPNAYRSRSLSRPKVEDIVATATDGSDWESGPVLDAVPPWNRTAAVVREISRSGGASLDSSQLPKNNTRNASRSRERVLQFGEVEMIYPEELPPDDVVRPYPSSGRMQMNSAPLWGNSLPTVPNRSNLDEESNGCGYDRRLVRKGATVTSSPYDRYLSKSAGGVLMGPGEGPTLLQRVDPRKRAPPRSRSGTLTLRDWQASAPAVVQYMPGPFETRDVTRRRSQSRDRSSRSTSLRRSPEAESPPPPLPSRRLRDDDEDDTGNDDEYERGRGRSNRDGDRRRSALLRSHSLGGPTTRREIEDRFVQVKAYFLIADFYVAVKISRNITFASLVRKLEDKAMAILYGAFEGDDRLVIDCFQYVDPEGTPIIVADEEDWAVCLGDTDAKLMIKCITA
ncbi:hypothetical protein DFJ73DRAFT_485082 [Zopfochytrium polystomum]|nr:hypothetical protein DFJ73DRAFT_485082 [Zopfochytrium polystomum]